MSLLVVIPALNEEKSIENVVKEIKFELPDATVLVIDDGSIDETAKIAKNSGASVISLPINLGVGGAIRVAYKFAVLHNFTQVLQIDADGQHLPSEISHLLNSASDNSVVIGSRFLANNYDYRVTKTRRFAMIVLAKILSLICKTKLTDVTSGFRLSTGNPIKIFAKDYPREYLADTVESLIIAHKFQIKISEVPVKMANRSTGSPSQNSIKSIWYLIRILLVVLLAKLKKY